MYVTFQSLLFKTIFKKTDAGHFIKVNRKSALTGEVQMLAGLCVSIIHFIQV